MKKLWFLLPIVLWIGNYFLWKEAAKHIVPQPTYDGIWWLCTCVLFFFGTCASVIWAVYENTDPYL